MWKSLAITATLAAAAHADPKRELPDYDGRGNAELGVEPWSLWIPRVALWPLYAVNEYLLRRPIGFVVVKAERGHWVDAIERFLHFGDHNQDLLIPTALFDFGLLPSVGLYFSGDDFITRDNALRLHAATWGPKWLDFTAADRYAIDGHHSVQARFEFRRAEDNLFFGIGPEVRRATQSRYGLKRIDGVLTYRLRFARESWLDVAGGVRRVAFVDGTCCADPSLDQRIADGQLVAPPGYRDDYSTGFAHASLSLDSREPRPAPGSGVYLHLSGTATTDLEEARSWIDYGAVVGGAVDLTGHQRTLKLQLAVELIDAMRGGPIPFTEYPVLSSALMPGFVTGWMTGLSTAAAQLGYTWPVWAWLDGQTRFTVGNAFGEHLGGLTPSRFRLSWDLGFTTSADRDQGFEVLFGVGTETLEQGASITSIRATFGSRRGF